MTPEEHLEKLTDLFREVSETFRVEPMTAEQIRASDRKWFAGIAMQGYLASVGVVGGPVPRDEDIARYSVDMADALLAALEETK